MKKRTGVTCIPNNIWNLGLNSYEISTLHLLLSYSEDIKSTVNSVSVCLKMNKRRVKATILSLIEKGFIDTDFNIIYDLSVSK